MPKIEEKPVQKHVEKRELGRALSQTNLNALNANPRNDEHRRSSTFLSTIGNNVIGKATPDVAPSYESREESKHYSGTLTARNSNNLNFNEYLAEYEKIKMAERNKSPAEHRSKYFNDVFNSKLNLGSKPDVKESPYVHRIMKEIQSKGEKAHYTPNRERELNIFKSDSSYQPQYIPQIPQQFSRTLEEKDILKPKNRYRNWEPIMRNLESSYEVKDIKLSPSLAIKDEDDLINPSRRVQIGGKKLFMDKNGIEKANNFSSGYMAPTYH